MSEGGSEVARAGFFLAAPGLAGAAAGRFIGACPLPEEVGGVVVVINQAAVSLSFLEKITSHVANASK